VKKSREPILNVPPVITVTLAALVLVHLVRTFVLSPHQDAHFVFLFSFLPARYDATVLADGGLPGGWAANIWTFVSYALIHGDVTHLGINAVWLLAFGTAIARRFGSWRFLMFFALTSAAGALAHLVTHYGEAVPMIGASAAISGCMAAAMRFAFQGGGPLELWRAHDPASYRVPAAPLVSALADPRILAFLAVWFGLNFLLGLGSLPLTDGQEVAWQAHVGGFVAGLLLFAMIDPIGPARADREPYQQRE
jgi:membrane associated rhomboid family serine protease